MRDRGAADREGPGRVGGGGLRTNVSIFREVSATHMHRRMRLLGALAILLMLQSAAAAQAAPPACPASKGSSHHIERANKALVRRFHEALNHQDWRTADSLVSRAYRHYVTGTTGFRAIAWDAVKRGNRRLRSAFPDWRNSVRQSIAEGDKVAVILEGSGTHRGSIAGEAATGRTATLPIMVVHQICRGKLVADWEIVDVAPLMESLKAR